MKYFLFITFLILNSSAVANSSKYRGGNVELLNKEDGMCFYIGRKNLKGDYELNIFHKKNFNKVYNYTSNFYKNYPTKENCLKVDYKFVDKEIYTAVLDTQSTNFGGDFCVINKDIGEYDGYNCVKNNISVWRRIKLFISSLFD